MFNKIEVRVLNIIVTLGIKLKVPYAILKPLNDRFMELTC